MGQQPAHCKKDWQAERRADSYAKRNGLQMENTELIVRNSNREVAHRDRNQSTNAERSMFAGYSQPVCAGQSRMGLSEGSIRRISTPPRRPGWVRLLRLGAGCPTCISRYSQSRQQAPKPF